MITIQMPVWTMWLFGAILLMNIVIVAIDVMVRMKTYRILQGAMRRGSDS